MKTDSHLIPSTGFSTIVVDFTGGALTTTFLGAPVALFSGAAAGFSSLAARAVSGLSTHTSDTSHNTFYCSHHNNL